MRFLKRFFLILLLVALFVPTVNAKDPCISPIIRSLKNIRLFKLQSKKIAVILDLKVSG